MAAGCSVPAAPSSHDAPDRLGSEVRRLEQVLQRSQTDLRLEIREADRRSAEALAEIQRSLARVGARLDDLGRETAQLQGRLDDLRRRVDTLSLQLDAAVEQLGPPPSAGRSAGGGPGRPSDPVAGAPGAAALASGAPASAGRGAAGQAGELYQAAYLDYTRGNYNLAIAAFREFIRLHPETDLAQKAQYWIGEAHFSLARTLQQRGERERAIQELEQAVQEFRRVLATYPRGERVPSALYKEALALAELGQPSLAEARLRFLMDQYPASEEATKAKEDLARLRRR
jgi:tol-pal system protein YbgF